MFFRNLRPSVIEHELSVENDLIELAFATEGKSVSGQTPLSCGAIAVQDVGGLGRWAFEEVELVDAAVCPENIIVASRGFVAALFGRQVEAPGAAIGQDDEGDAGVEGVFEGLADGVFGFAGLFDFDEDGGFGGRMAEGKVGAALTGLVFRPDDGGVPRVPAQLLEDAEDDALGDGLFVGEPALAQAVYDIRKCGLKRHTINR